MRSSLTAALLTGCFIMVVTILVLDVLILWPDHSQICYSETTGNPTPCEHWF